MSFYLIGGGVTAFAVYMGYKYFNSNSNKPCAENIIHQKPMPTKSLIEDEKEDWLVGVSKKDKKKNVDQDIVNLGFVIKTKIDFGPTSSTIFYMINSDYDSITKLYDLDGVTSIERDRIAISF